MKYVRRFRMEIDIRRARLPEPLVPAGYFCVPWNPSLLDRHALVKYRSFCSELDSRVFECLGQVAGCRRLMSEIAGQDAFLASATWLLTYAPSRGRRPVDCGTIQGMRQHRKIGGIQNVGVVPEHRGLGLGRVLMLKSLHGFRDAGMKRVYLEVTASNRPAVALYRSLGFRLTRTLYKQLEVQAVETVRSY